MMKTFKFVIVLGIAAICACVTATVDAPNVCDTTSIGTIPAAPAVLAGVSVPPVSFSRPSDLSGTIKKISDVADGVNVSVTQLFLNGDSDLQWISQVDVSVNGGTPDTPDAPLASYKSSGVDPGNSINLTVQMDTNTAYRYLSNPVTLTFTVAGQVPDQAVVLTNTMCVEATGNFSKSL